MWLRQDRRHHVGSDGFLRYNASYRILLNNATSLELIEDSDAQLETSSILSTSALSHGGRERRW